MLRVAPDVRKSKPDFIANLDSTVESVKQIPWGTLEELEGDPEIIKKMEDAEALLQSLRQSLSPKGDKT